MVQPDNSVPNKILFLLNWDGFVEISLMWLRARGWMEE